MCFLFRPDWLCREFVVILWALKESSGKDGGIQLQGSSCGSEAEARAGSTVQEQVVV